MYIVMGQMAVCLTSVCQVSVHPDEGPRQPRADLAWRVVAKCAKLKRWRSASGEVHFAKPTLSTTILGSNMDYTRTFCPAPTHPDETMMACSLIHLRLGLLEIKDARTKIAQGLEVTLGNLLCPR